MNVPYSRHFSSLDVQEVRVDQVRRQRMISLLDQEQLTRDPSSQERWNQRKQVMVRIGDDQNMCPCLVDMFRRQSEEMNKILVTRHLDLSKAGQLDHEQLLEQRRVSLPLVKFVAVIDDQQQQQQQQHINNTELIKKVVSKMKKCQCPESVQVPKVHVIPCTPLIHTEDETVKKTSQEELVDNFERHDDVEPRQRDVER